MIPKKMDSETVESILGCFYGIPIKIYDYEAFYELYENLEFFGVIELLEQMHTFLMETENLHEVLIGI
jgi:hypothetical protein